MVAHTCNPSTLGGWGRWITWGQEFETRLANLVKLLSLPKSTKIIQVWWHARAAPATEEAEVGESLEPGRWRLQWVEIMPLYSSLVNRVRPCLKKKLSTALQPVAIEQDSASNKTKQYFKYPLTCFTVKMGKVYSVVDMVLWALLW